MTLRIPPDQVHRPLVEQVRINEDAGYSPLRARLAVLDVIVARARQELDRGWCGYGPIYAARLEKKARAFWRGFWGQLEHDLGRQLEDAAIAQLDKAIWRVEPLAAGGRS